MDDFAPVTERRKVLIVDDDRQIADTLTQILSQRGYDVATAYDGREGPSLET